VRLHSIEKCWNMNMSKKILICLVLVSAHSVVWDTLKLMSVVAVTDSSAKPLSILFTMATIIAFGSLIKNRYWIVACIFAGLNRISRIAVAMTAHGLSPADNIMMASIIAVGILCGLASLYYFSKLFADKTFNFRSSLRFGGSPR